MDLSVIIVNYNTRDALGRCLASLVAHLPREAETEIIVADNGSEDGSREYVAREFPSVSVLGLDNRGYSAAVNAALGKCSGREVLLLNADVELTQESCERMSRNLNANPLAGLVGPRHVGLDGKTQLTCGLFPNLRREIRRKRLQSRMDRGDEAAVGEFEREHSRTMPVDWVSGSCMLFRMQAVLDAGGWDENYFLFFEDIDWCKSLRDADWQVVYVPEAIVVHIHGASARKFASRAERAYRLSQLYFARKHFGHISLFLTRLYLTLKFGVVIVKGVFAREKATGVVDCLAALWSPVPPPPEDKIVLERTR